VTYPRLTIIAGANGCGKSTLTSRSSFIYKTPLLDPDAINKAFQPSIPGASAVAAARQVLISAERHIKKGESFAVETTLAGMHYLQRMVDARNRSFEVVLVYIGTENVEINLARIRDRVLTGGHDVPESDVRRRYQRSFKSLL
jgi:predicted ABC-type ATPase